MKVHRLSGKDYAKAIGIGIATAIALSAIMVTALKTGVSPLPKPVALAFANTLFNANLPLPVGLLFHVAWVTLWSLVYIVLFRDRLTLGRALGLGLVLWALALVVFFPFIGWGFLGLAVSPKLIVAALISHVLFALILWASAQWTFAPSREQEGERYSGA
jgi:hypothetical protein